jgi:hypothetical protein
MAAKKNKSEADKAKKKLRGKVKKEMRDEIKAAVESIPALIINEFKENTVPETVITESAEPKIVNERPAPHPRPPRLRQVILWLGVTVITLSVIIMWGWNMQAAFSDQKIKVSAEEKIVKSAKTEINKIFNTGIENAGSVRRGIAAVIETQKAKAETEKSVKESLAMILSASNQANPNPTSTTSTPAAITVSTTIQTENKF